MEKSTVKSGKEILDDFFKDIADIENVDVTLANSLAELYFDGKLTDKSVANELQKIREHNVNKD
jgi:N-acetylneuraminic acid mutarotase